MFERFKKIIKREKGFTLVELLAVIAILGIIVAIAVPTIGNVIGNAETEATNATEELIENAARLAEVSGVTVPAGGYTLSDLEEAGYLEEVPEGYDGSEKVTKTDNAWTFGVSNP